MNHYDLAEMISNEIAKRKQALHPMLVAFDGVDTSGKTTLADNVNESLKRRGFDSIRISIDKFHNLREVRVRRGEYSPEGFFYDSFNYDKVLECVILPVKNNESSIRGGVYDYKTEGTLEDNRICISPHTIILFDGIFMHRDELYEYWNLSVFLDVTFETVRKRAISRDREYFGSEEKVLEKYNKRYIPGEEIYLKKCKPEERATYVIDNNDWQNPIIIKGHFI
jgi:uridine kinase